MAIDFNDNLQIRAPKPIDDRFGPWSTTAEALANIPRPYRYIGLVVNIDGIDYWFDGGVDDEYLVEKQYGSGTSDPSEKWEAVTGTESILGYGYLYNAYAFKDLRGLAPIGWHVPSQVEWMTLYNFLGGTSIAGQYLKEAGPANWGVGNNGTNSVGFTALPGGYYSVYYHEFYNRLQEGFWWTSTYYDPYASTPWLSDTTIYSYYTVIDAAVNSIGINPNNNHAGYSIRLIRDTGNTATTCTDYDGNVYQSITIGTQTWLTTNLTTTHYNNGDPIGTDWSLNAGSHAAYNNDTANLYYQGFVEDLVHIRPKHSKRILTNIIDGITDYTTFDNFVYNEIPTGLINGINTSFTSLHNFIPESVQVFVNGVKQKIIDDYQTSGSNSITLTDSLTVNENININYIKL